MTSSLFISYASDDQAIAMEVCALLEAQGVRCWIAPRDVAPGAKWDEAIVDAITNAGAFLLILTSAANESPYVGNEVNHAFAAKKPIFTFRVEDVQPNKSLGFYLARHHWTDGFAAPLEQTVPQLATALTALVGADTPVPATARKRVALRARSPRWRRALLGTAAVAIAALGGYAGWVVKPSRPFPVTRFSVALPGPIPSNFTRRLLALSPDGRRLAYAVDFSLFVQGFDQHEPLLVTTLAGPPSGLFFSPDGQWIGFYAVQRLQKVPVAGGAPVTLCDLGTVQGGASASWGPDDTIVFAQGSRIRRVSGNGGACDTIVDLDDGQIIYGPQILPDGKTVLFTLSPSGNAWGEQSEVVAHSLDTGERTILTAGGKAATFVPSGHLVYAGPGGLVAVPFDAATNRVTDDPVSLGLDDLSLAAGVPAAQFAVAEAGTLAFVPGSAESGVRLVWVDRQGREEPITIPERPYFIARLSPDGTRLALDVREAQNDIWIWDFRRETLTRLTLDPANDFNPAWSPDGRRIAYTSTRGGRPNLYWQSADGVGVVERLTESPDVHNLRSFSPDGRLLLVDTPAGIGTVPLAGDRRYRSLVDGLPLSNLELSPDGRWIAYQSTETGRPEIYVRPFPDVNAGRWQISNDGGTRPLWARSGRELFYYVEPGMLMAVSVDAGSTFTPGSPRLLFEGPYVAPIAPRNYDVSPDGERFLMMKRDAATARSEIRVVLNWVEELKRLVP